MRGEVIRDVMRGRWPLLATAALCMLASTVGYALAVPAGGDAVDALLAGGDARGAALRSLVLAIGGCLSWSLSDLLMNEVSTSVAVRLRARMVRHTLSLPIGFFTDRSVGEMTDRISTDVDTVAKGVVDQAKPVAMGALGAVVAFVTSWTIDPRLTVLFVPASVGIAVAGVIAGRRVATTGRQVQARWADAAGTAEEAFNARDDLRQALGRGLIMRRWSEHSHLVFAEGRRAVVARNLLTLATFGLLRAFQLLVLLGGGLLAVRGEVGAGTVWAAFGLVTLFSRRIEEVLHNLPRLSDTIAAAQRIGELLEEEPEPAVTATDPLGAAVRWHEPVAVVLDRVTFAYGDGPVVLDDVSVTVRPGRSLAIVGRTGSGKTTLACLVNRTIDPPAGTVFLDGVDVRAIDRRELRRHVGIVTQRVELLQATLRDNVTLFDPDISDERIVAAFDLLGLGDWLDGLPAGLDSELATRRVELSAGEQQLVAFARLLVREPAVVVLDEATARLDPVTEAVLQRATERLLAGRTSIIIAHRLATIAGVDDVVVLDGGRVVEHGPRRALLADDATRFARLVEADTGGRAAAELPPSGPVVAPIVRSVGGDAARRPDEEPSSTAPKVPLVRTTLRMLRRHPRVALPGAVGWCVYLAMPAVMAWVWSTLLPTVEARGSIAVPVGIFAAAAAIGLALRMVGEHYFTQWWNASTATLRSNILAAQLHPDDRFAGRRPASPGDATSRMWDALDVVRYSDHYVDIFASIVFLLAATALSGRWSTALWLIAPVALPLSLALTVHRSLERVAVEHARLRSTWSGRVADVCAAATTIKGFACEAHAEAHLDSWTRRRQRAALVQRRYELAVFGSVFLTSVAGARIALVVPALAPIGSVSAATVGTAVAVAEALAMMPIAGLMACMLLQEAPMVRAKLTRMARLLPDRAGFDLTRAPADFRLPPAPTASVPTRRPDRQGLRWLRAEGLRVVHPDGTVALDDAAIDVRAGELVVVTGPVASGKSTLLRLLAGLETSESGVIWWNGDEVDEPSRFLRPPNCAYVAQTPRLVSGTVAENVALDHDVDVAGALVLAQLDEDVARAGGPATIIGHRGLRLSGGQAQRLATARAAASESELLVLDDLSSALDVMTERQVWRHLRAAGRTVVASSYKRVALELADRVVVLDGGRVTAEGPWHELEPTHGHLFA
jgi:ATP-binding cassette subfamily B protein